MTKSILNFSTGKYESTCGTSANDQLKKQIEKMRSAIAKQGNKKNPTVDDNAEIMSNLKEITGTAATQVKKNMCAKGTECYNNLLSKNLQATFLKAENNALTAPDKLKEAEKNYYIQIKGEDGWNEIQKDRALDQADREQETLLTVHTQEIARLIKQLQEYINDSQQKEWIDDYITDLQNENKELKKKISKNNSVFFTNERKIWYEDREYDGLGTYSTIALVFYCVVALIFGFYFFKKKLWKPNGYRNNRVDTALFIIFIFWPIFNLIIVKFIFKIIYFGLNQFPKDAYAHLVG